MEFVSYNIESNDFREAGAASRAIKEHLKRIGAEAEAIRRTMIAAYEAEMNVVIHSVGGRLEASLSDTRIDVNVVDGGPGIPDIEMAMKEGYSTASAEARALGFGAGMGLPNIKRSSDRLRVTSRVGEGTRVSFSIYLRPEVTRTAPSTSLYASSDRCRDCRACLTACPTQALRVRNGRPMVLEHLCIDCAQCIAACVTGALTIGDVLRSVDDLKDRAAESLVVPPALLAGFGPDHSPEQTLNAVGRLGFADARTAGPFEAAVRVAAMATPRTADVPTPLILPMCPAVVNLVELKFPSLVDSLAPLATPWEAVEVAGGGAPLACVISCPGQRSAVAAREAQLAERGGAAIVDCLLPEALRVPVMKELTSPSPTSTGESTAPTVATTATTAATAIAGKRAATSAGDVAAAAARKGVDADESATAVEDEILVVSGIRHVMAILEQIEDGRLEDVAVVEAYACEGGCFGSPLLFEDHHVARRRWMRGGLATRVREEALPKAAAPAGAGAQAAAIARAEAVAAGRPYAARPGIRLDPDMSKAIQKLGRLKTVTESLPARDCGACGAPTCAALAEDVVMERASVDLCPYLSPEKEDAES